MQKMIIRTEANWTADSRGLAHAAEKPPIEFSMPPEFHGPEGVWNPEDLFVSAIETCLMLTCLARLRSHKLEWVGYKSHAIATLENGPDGTAFTRVDVYFRIDVSEEAEKVLELVKTAHHHCPVARSLAFKVDLHPEVVQVARLHR